MKTYRALSISFLIIVLGMSMFQIRIYPMQQSNMFLKSNVFMENQGNIIDQYGYVNNDVLYSYNSKGMNIQLKKNSFSYDVYAPKVVAHTNSSIHSQYIVNRIDIELLGANINPDIRAIQSPEVIRMNIGQVNHGNNHLKIIRAYSKVIYSEIYPLIDLEWFVNDNNEVEYNFIIKPGGDPNKIQMKYHGIDSMNIAYDSLNIFTPKYVITEHIPLCYTVNNNVTVQGSYRKSAFNVIAFNIDRYSLTDTLVIDPIPSIAWSTYYGGAELDIIRDMAVDNNGNAYMVGETSSIEHIASIGSYQSTIGGYLDVFIVCMSKEGNRLWSTYYGGPDDDRGYGIAIDINSNVWITGWTNSQKGIATDQAKQTLFGGFLDGFIAKYTSQGQLIWATYLGGPGIDDAIDIAIVNGVNACIIGTSSSTSGITTSSSHQEENGGKLDIMIAKYTANGNLDWCTYMGGTMDDRGYAIAVDSDDSIWITGETTSENGISNGIGKDTLTRFSDVCIGKFSSDGERIIGQYFGGNGYDRGNSIKATGSGHIIIGGNTNSSFGISTIGAEQETIGGSTDGFITSFDKNGTLLWSTYFGGKGIDNVNSIDVQNESILISGSTTSTDNISSIDAPQLSSGGLRDASCSK